MPPLSLEAARDFIGQVRKKNGGITEETRKFLEDNAKEALEALQNSRRQLADSLKIVVDNLYSKETRFLYELIQNAEDNSYTKAAANGEVPFLAFKVYPDRIIIDSNEDGFSEDNIKAICSVGKSTKRHSVGYIGEKGIGFKSVFKIAQKVHIQSGPFSFAFRHTRDNDDDGLGMITPYYEDPENLQAGVSTRITLTLLDSTKFEERASEFRNIPDTFLMFLSQLRRLSIELNQPSNPPLIAQYSKRESEENGLYTTSLTKTTRKGKEESTSAIKFYIMKRDLQNLPFDEARKDKQGNRIDQATVILAFPVDERDEPVLEQQYTYAFLPLRRVGFKFLIQADFITQANREDVIHSSRNQAILKGVADAFMDAMIVFCKRPSLKYSWMRYLPEESISDDFWRTLSVLVYERLKQTSILEPWSGKGFYKPSNLEKLSEKHVDDDGNPLLADLQGAEVYLSPKYREADFQILRRLGTGMLKWSNFVDRLEADIRTPSISRWKILYSNNEWRTRICNVLLEAFTQDITTVQQRLRQMTLVPLYDFRWVASISPNKQFARKLYFPKTGAIHIPKDLRFDLVHSKAAANHAWSGLLSALGVISCPQDSVIGSINSRYIPTNLLNFKLVNAVAHMRYLYWFLPKEYSSLDPQIRLVNQHESLLKKDQYFYFPDGEDEYSPSKLFKQDDQLLGHPVNYLHQDYLKKFDANVVHNGRSWSRWLEEMVGVRRIPKLTGIGGDATSKEFRYIIERRSDMLLGIIKRGWSSYSPLICGAVKQELCDSNVLLENGQRAPLAGTFLPLPRLKQRAMELGVSGEFPFIAMFEILRDEVKLDWIFAQKLLIRTDEDLEFYAAALTAFKTINPNPKTPSAKDQLARIYRNLQSKGGENFDCIRRKFESSFIWVEFSNMHKSTWLTTADCVWDGPQWLKSKQCLKSKAYLELEHLFKLVLELPDASQEDVVEDLLMLKNYNRDPITFRVQSTTDTQSSYEAPSAPYLVCREHNVHNLSEHYQNITVVDIYQKQSFEELRLQDYGMGRKPLSVTTSKNNVEVFAGLETNKIIEEAEMRYQYLYQKYHVSISSENSGDWKRLRFAFEDSALVYVPKEKAWYPPSKCVWMNSAVKIPGKVSIGDTYPLKKTFFTRVLGISEPTVEMFIDSLKAGADGQATAAQTKETMRLICGLGIGQTDVLGLSTADILPVKLTKGTLRFISASAKDTYVDFAVVDNAIHWDAFKDKINALDFSLEEIRDTRPLLQAIGLEERFSSKLVKEITDVKDGSQDHGMTRTLRIKSQAIIRFAFHFASPEKRLNVASVYRKFERAKVHVSDGINCSLQITQGGRDIKGAISRANFHIEELDGALQFYLPKDEVERDVCLESDLPRRLCSFLEITDPAAPGVIGGLFRKDNPAVINKILEKAGVGQVDFDFPVLDEELGSLEADWGADSLVQATSNIKLSAPDSRQRPQSPVGLEGTPSQNENAADTARALYQGRQHQTQEKAYRRILENVVDVARSRIKSGLFESTGFFANHPVAIKALPQETIREAVGGRTQERDFQVGAAGELYVLEFLKGLDLPNFGIDNWKSEIRDRVRLHPDYRNIENYTGRKAIADIEYQDTSGKFTQFLTEKGHLADELWESERPLYHIEVKATTSSDWQEPFYLSKYQERHIRDMRIDNGETSSVVYMICRIFNLGKGDDTGVHVYLDPETKRQDQELEFTTHQWTVKPLWHPNMLLGKTKPETTRAVTSAPTSSTSAVDSANKIPPNPITSTTLGPSASTRAPVSGNSLFEALRPESSIFGSNSPTARNNTTNQPHIKPSGFGSAQPALTGGLFGSKPGGSFGSNSGGSFGSNPGGSFGSNSGGLFGSNPGGSFGSNSGGLFGSNPGGSFGSKPGGLFGSNPGGTFGSNPGGSFGSNPGGSFGSPSTGSVFGASPSISNSRTPNNTTKSERRGVSPRPAAGKKAEGAKDEGCQ